MLDRVSAAIIGRDRLEHGVLRADVQVVEQRHVVGGIAAALPQIFTRREGSP